MHRYSLNMKSIDEKVSLDGDFSSALNMAKERLGVVKNYLRKQAKSPREWNFGRLEAAKITPTNRVRSRVQT